ncbi:MAG: AIR synthase related protein [Promethearchaeia archaeon]
MLQDIADSIRTNKNILEKKEVNPIVQYIDQNSFKSLRIHSDIGEDSAAIKDVDTYILVTTDRIKTKFIENFPFGAGFSSILVGIDDIYCCGGTPLAASLIVSFKDKEKGQQIIEGVCEGSQKFNIPIIRGHTNPNSPSYELSITLIGEIKKDNYISAKNAQVGDYIILAVDHEGKVAKASKNYWDTTTFKDSEKILFKRGVLKKLAEEKLVNASKDISNGGIFGTLLQLIKYSRVGANVNINKIKIPDVLLEQEYSLKEYIRMYLTTSYILTAPQENCKKVIKYFKEHQMTANVIGKIIKDKNLLMINNGKTSIEVLKF